METSFIEFNGLNSVYEQISPYTYFTSFFKREYVMFAQRNTDAILETCAGARAARNAKREGGKAVLP